MYYSNYNPFYIRNRHYYNRNIYNTYSPNTLNNNEKNEEKKDTGSPQNDTISFQKFYNNNVDQNNNDNTYHNEDNKNYSSTNKRNSRFISFDKTQINILGFSFEIDDLIIIGIIILLLLESDENYALIIILGLILLNINLSDILNIF